MYFARVFSRLSVRARIIVLGVIPVIGFLANGIAFISGDAEVGNAFDSVHRNTVVSDASRDLKTGLLMMRAATIEFVAHPSDAEVKDFDDGQDMAIRCLDRIENVLTSSEQDTITPLRITVRDLKTSFSSLVHEQKSLGFTDAEGVTANLIAASDSIEKIIQDDLSWVAESRQHQALDVASHHAPLRDRIPAHAQSRRRAPLPRRDQALQPAFRFGRRRPVDEREAQSRSAELQLRLRAMGREHGQYRAACLADQPRHRERAAGGRQDHRHGARRTRARRRRRSPPRGRARGNSSSGWISR